MKLIQVMGFGLVVAVILLIMLVISALYAITLCYGSTDNGYDWFVPKEWTAWCVCRFKIIIIRPAQGPRDKDAVNIVVNEAEKYGGCIAGPYLWDWNPAAHITRGEFK